MQIRFDILDINGPIMENYVDTNHMIFHHQFRLFVS